MRRKEREVNNREDFIEILANGKVCFLGLNDQDYPYVLPTNYGYTLNDNELTLYFHGALEGKKIDLLKANNKVGFSINSEKEIVVKDSACNATCKYGSIIGNGDVIFIEDSKEKVKALENIYFTLTNQEAVLNDDNTRNVCVFKLVASNYSGKMNK